MTTAAIIQRWRLWFVVLSLCLLLVLAALPSTGWLVRSQLKLQIWPFSPPDQLYYLRKMELPLLGQWSHIDAARMKAAEHAVAKRRPNDFQLQLADALYEMPDQHSILYGYTPEQNIKSDSDTNVALHLNAMRLRPLLAHFADRPSLYANILRYAAKRCSSENRDELSLFFGEEPQKPATARDKHAVTPEELAEFDREATKGERLEPENAYFPLMRAIGLFTAHRDAEALAAIFRASQKTGWKDYVEDEAEGRWRLMEEATGDHSAVSRAAIWDRMLPSLDDTALNSIVVVATYKAMLAEASGRMDDGLALRSAIIRCVRVMRLHTTSDIGGIVSYSITRTATARPGIGPRPRHKPGLLVLNSFLAPSETAKRVQQEDYYRVSMENVEQISDANFCGYLRQFGHIQEARLAEQELQAGEQAHQQVYHGSEDVGPDSGLPSILYWHLSGEAILLSAFWMLVVGALETLLARSRSVNIGKPLPVYERWGIGIGFCALILDIGLLIAEGLESEPPFSDLSVVYLFRFGALYGITIILIGIIVLRFGRSGLLRGLGICITTGGGATALTALWFWQVRPNLSSMIGQYSSVMPDYARDFNMLLKLMAILAPFILSPLIVIMFCCLCLSIRSLVRHIPLSVGLIRGLRSICIPVACLLILAYCGVVVGTVRAENRKNLDLEKYIRER